MSITPGQRLRGLAEAYEAREREIMRLRTALLAQVRTAMAVGTKVTWPCACAAFRDHPCPWFAERCACAARARAMVAEPEADPSTDDAASLFEAKT